MRLHSCAFFPAGMSNKIFQPFLRKLSWTNQMSTRSISQGCVNMTREHDTCFKQKEAFVVLCLAFYSQNMS